VDRQHRPADGIGSPRTLFIGRATLDVLYSLNQFPAQDTKTFAQATHAAPGGPATNAAITYALLGGRAVLITSLGGGPWASVVRDQLQRLGIEIIDLAAETPYETPLTVVLVDQSEATRTIVNPPPSSVRLKSPPKWDSAWGEFPTLIMTDGFHLGEILPLLRTLHTNGAQICLDGGSWKEGTDELAPLLSIAICSERFTVPGTQSGTRSTIGWFAERGVSQIAITRGPRPILGWDRKREFTIEVAKIDAVDTTGAGDVLHGAFCFHFARTGDFELALKQASEIATRSCLTLGVRAWSGRDDAAIGLERP
jgi:sugar/nucleoside kinase (ribokinase family)